MESRAKLLGHPIHQMLIVFPLGLLSAGVVFDIIGLMSDNPLWGWIAYYLLGAGIVTGLVAAVFGAIDYFAIPRGTRAKYVGTLHGVGNVLVVALFGAGWLLRQDTPAEPPVIAVLFSVLAFLLSGATAWLGGELVDRLGVGVDDGAHLNSPSSLSGRPASEGRTIATQGSGYQGTERRGGPQLAYAGVERRSTR